MSTRGIKEKYYKEVIPLMKKKFGYRNDLAVPKIEKVIINSGIGKYRQDPKALEEIEQALMMISGQKPVKTLAKKAISAFKIKKGMNIGLMVTLRRKKMYDFLDRLINLVLPRIRDFHGLEPKSVDNSGNLTIGIKEHIVFPEISHEDVHHIFGLEVTVVTTAKTKEEGLELLKLIGFPIKNFVQGSEPVGR